MLRSLSGKSFVIPIWAQDSDGKRHLAPYFADFLCLTLKLIVEIDGGQHAESESDVIRTKYLEGLGFKVIRFWNSEVEESLEGVVLRIEEALAERRADKGK